jgi:hypothetical protein
MQPDYTPYEKTIFKSRSSSISTITTPIITVISLVVITRLLDQSIEREREGSFIDLQLRTSSRIIAIGNEASILGRTD